MKGPVVTRHRRPYVRNTLWGDVVIRYIVAAGLILAFWSVRSTHVDLRARWADEMRNRTRDGVNGRVSTLAMGLRRVRTA